jgi:hypothetical protein
MVKAEVLVAVEVELNLIHRRMVEQVEPEAWLELALVVIKVLAAEDGDHQVDQILQLQDQVELVVKLLH